MDISENAKEPYECRAGRLTAHIKKSSPIHVSCHQGIQWDCVRGAVRTLIHTCT